MKYLLGIGACLALGCLFGCSNDAVTFEPSTGSAQTGSGGTGTGGDPATSSAGSAQGGSMSNGSGGSGAAGGSGGSGATGGSAGAGGAGGAGGSGGGGPTAAECFVDIAGPITPNYDQFNPTVGSHCKGTNHQTITGIEKVVFLGDSVTAGTPPTLSNQYYRNVLTNQLQQKFGAIEVANCSEWGARTDDLLLGGQQIAACFPNAVEPKRTLVVMTMGGNDIANWAQNQMTTAQAMAEADVAAQLLRDAISWFYIDPNRFPNGVFVVFANVYEYTDATGDLLSCPTATLAGFNQNWPQGIPAVVYFEELYMQIAVDTGTDMTFMMETFCGHGYHHNDANSQCYRGPNTENWFDLTCIHPTPTGHNQIAQLFYSTIDE